MTRLLTLLVTTGLTLTVQLATAANDASALKGCAAKVANIENELIIAKSKNQTRKAKGLEDALSAAKKCDDQTLTATQSFRKKFARARRRTLRRRARSWRRRNRS